MFMVRTQDHMDRFLEKLRSAVPDRVTTTAQVIKMKDEMAEVEHAVASHDDTVLQELADVVIVAMVMADCEGHDILDLLDEVDHKLAINAARDWYPTASGTARHTPEEN